MRKKKKAASTTSCKSQKLLCYATRSGTTGCRCTIAHDFVTTVLLTKKQRHLSPAQVVAIGDCCINDSFERAISASIHGKIGDESDGHL
jgi:hypothetical protein